MKNIFVLLVLFPLFSKAQIITTIAGDGMAGFSGDGGPATIAVLNSPRAVALDNFGNIYIVDQDNQRIRKINSSGDIYTIIGNGLFGYNGDGESATLAKLFDPTDIISDNSGNIYIADAGNLRLRKINSSGIISTIAGNGVAGYAGDGGPATLCNFNDANSVVIDNAYNTYVSDANNNCIRKINPLGIISTIVGNGIPGYTGDGGPATIAELNYPSGLAIDKFGSIFIADAKNNCIRKVDTLGIITTIAGDSIQGYSGDGGIATIAELNLPTGVCLDHSGNIYIADNNNNCIRKVDSSGIITTIAGNGHQGYSGDGGPASSAELSKPWSVAIDVSANIYVADNGNHCIRKISSGTTDVSSIPMLNSKIFFYPNPATSSLTVSSPDNISQITITNLLGQTIYTNNYITNKAEVNVANLPPGIYFVEINGSEVRKFVKE